MQVLPGARLPGDGIVVEGSSHTDESMLTGEAAPVLKGPGDAVIGGTVNMGGMLVVLFFLPTFLY
jgi:Cu+-exporting ATPase